MTYATIATIAYDQSLYRRLVASAAEEQKMPPFEQWVVNYRWELAATPGWAAAWESAVAAGNPDPGADETVITDGMILSAVQPMGEPPVPPTPPTVSAIEPSSAVQGGPDLEVHLIGTGFTADSVIVWNGGDEPTNFVSATDVWTTVKPSTVTTPGSYPVYVRNADGQVSGIVQFTFDPAPEPEPLTITALEPASASITDADFEGHIRGTGFTEATQIIWNGAPEPTTFIDSTDVWTLVKPSVVTAPTVLDVWVVDEGVASNIVQFTWEA